MQYDYCRNIINRIMTLTALGAFAIGLLLASINSCWLGFYVCDLGYRCAAFGIWGVSVILLLLSIVFCVLFAKSYRRYKTKEDIEDKLI